MVATGSILLAGTAIASALFRAFVKPKIDLAGAFRKVGGLNNDRCTLMPELEGCEDMWLHHETGLAYLACAPVDSRPHWLPAIYHLNRSAVPTPTKDFIAVLDTQTLSHEKLRIADAPDHIQRLGLHVHGIDLFVHPDGKRATLFAINHVPPEPYDKAFEIGAQSVIEVFETTIGSGEAKWIGSVEHPLIRTPNNLVAVSPTSFYVTNDHKEKIHWARTQAMFITRLSEIVHCSIAEGFAEPECITAADGFHHPNGIAKGPDETLYMATSLSGRFYAFEIQADHTLALIDDIPIHRIPDNIHVAPSGAVYLATIPKGFDFQGMMRAPAPKEGRSAVEVWRIRNGTGVDSYHGGRLVLERVFGDDGTTISGVTNAVPYRNKLWLAGIGAKALAVCDVDPEFAA